jgi:hypothetical protein
MASDPVGDPLAIPIVCCRRVRLDGAPTRNDLFVGIHGEISPGGCPNVTADAPVKPVSVVTTDEPTYPLVGPNEVIVGIGDGVTSKLATLDVIERSNAAEAGRARRT